MKSTKELTPELKKLLNQIREGEKFFKFEKNGKTFDSLVRQLFKLRDLKFIKFPDKGVLRNRRNNDSEYLSVGPVEILQ